MNATLNEMTRASILDALRIVQLAVQRGDLTLAEVFTAVEVDAVSPLALYSILALPSKS